MSFVLNNLKQFEGIPAYDFEKVPGSTFRRDPLGGERLTFGESFESDYIGFEDVSRSLICAEITDCLGSGRTAQDIERSARKR